MLEEDWHWTARVLLSDPDALETAAKQFRGIGCATDRLRTRRGGRGSHGAGIGRTARQVRRLRAPSDYSPLRARPRCRCRSQERGLMGVRTTGEVAAGAVVTEWRSLLHPKGRGRMD
jgi:hypothetical protein